MDPTPRIFEFSHSVEMMIFLLMKGSCTKTELYDGVCRSQALPRRLDDLEAAGLLSQERAGRSTVLRLTDRGVRVAELLEEAVAVMRGDERRQGPQAPCTSSHPPYRSVSAPVLYAVVRPVSWRKGRGSRCPWA